MSDARVTDLILQRLGNIETKLDRIAEKGCAKAPDHERFQDQASELFGRVRSIEQSQAEGRGKLAVIMLFAGGIISLFFTWLGKQLG